MVATCECARIASTTASSPQTQRLRALAEDSGSWSKPAIMPSDRSLICLQPFSATRATIKCFLSAAVASDISITATVASLGGASSSAGPNTRCRRRRPPSSSPSNALTWPTACGCCANSPFTNTRGHDDSCAACSAAIPFQPQPAVAAEQVVGRRWQVRR